jgi:hypothetical protein
MSDLKIQLGGTSSPEALFETLRAEREMYKTYLDYFFFLDRKEPCELAGECFTENAEVTYHMKGSPLIFRSRSSYVSWLKDAAAAQEMTAHVAGQHCFEWTGGRPRLITYVTSWQWFVHTKHLGANRAADFVTVGYSEDDFEYVAGKWLIARRIVRPAAGLVAAGSLPES